VVRGDLKLDRGKLAGQVAHAAVSAAEKSRWKKEWLAAGQKKVVLKCVDLGELLSLFEQATVAGLPVELISDAGRTQIPVGTVTCFGLGPAPEDLVDRVTGRLKLL